MLKVDMSSVRSCLSSMVALRKVPHSNYWIRWGAMGIDQPTCTSVKSTDFRKLTTKINIEVGPLIGDDFACATREELTPHVIEKIGGIAIGLKAGA